MRIVTIIVLVYMGFPIALLSQTGSITNIQVAQRTDGSGNVDIFYNLTGPTPNYFISMEVSFNNGSSFTAVSSTYPSENNSVIPGSNRHLIWNGKISNNNTYSAQAKIKLIANTSIPCGQSFTDSRDGKSYNTVKIGTQCWMKENLNTGTMINGYLNQTNNQMLEKYCYANHESNCTEYGGLYQWNEVMQYTITPKVQGICPQGWYLPTNGDWTVLINFLGGEAVAGGLMKEEGTAHWSSPNTGATNESGFTALPGGLRYTYDIGFALWHSYTWFWSSSEYSPAQGASQNLVNYNSFIYLSANGDPVGNSVRCLKGDAMPTVSTIPVSNITPTSAISGGIIVNDGGSLITSKGVCWSTTAVPTIADFHTTDGAGAGTFTSYITGFSLTDHYYVRAYATNGVGTSYGNEVNFTMSGTTSGPCPGIPNITDPRNGKLYNTVQIGTQCWLKENLNIGSMVNSSIDQTNNGIIEKYCAWNDEGGCDIYGGLYQWDEMMQYTLIPGVQGLCPFGWHIPTDGEWTTITTYLGGGSQAGGKMKEAGTVHWQSPNVGASNESEFTALPGGARYPSGIIYDLSQSAKFWSSTEWIPTHSLMLRLDRSSPEVGRQGDDKPHGYSIRCIKN